MNLTTFLIALTGLGLVTTSLISTSHQPHPQAGQQPPKGSALLFWDQADANKNMGKWRSGWEPKCVKALIGAGCDVGMIHEGLQTLKKPNGVKVAWLNVEGAPLTNMEDIKKMRVFKDGSSADGWYRHLHSQQGQKTLLRWNPVDAYNEQRQRKLYWETLCDVALARVGCGVGIIHQGQAKLIKDDGSKMPYVRVEAAPRADMNPRKLRVFQDGSVTEGWTQRDQMFISAAKRQKRMRAKRPKKVKQPVRVPHSPKAFVSWDPASSYGNKPAKREHWERMCEQALTKEGCGVGMIHMGESKAFRNGAETPYVRVEGAPTMGMEYGKQMRVFHDGSYEYGWSKYDRRMMAKAKIPFEAVKPPEPRTALLSWEPADAYGSRIWRKLRWERLCDRALTKEGCVVGRIHVGESKAFRNGAEMPYIRVEGAKAIGQEEYGTRMRVYENGSYEHGWSQRDRELMWKSKTSSDAGRRRREKRLLEESTHASTQSSIPAAKRPRGPDPLQSLKNAVSPVVASAGGAQALPLEHSQGNYNGAKLDWPEHPFSGGNF